MFCHQLRRTVRQELILLDHNIALRPHGPEITQFDFGEIGLEDQDVVQLDIQVTPVFGVDPIQSGAYLPSHPFGVYLSDALIIDIGSEVT